MKTKLLISTIIFALTFAFNTANAQAPDYKWAVNAIGTGDDRGFKICADNNGNIIVTGRYHSKELMFDNIKLLNSDQDSSTADIFIVKYSPEAKVLWAKSIGGFGFDFATDCSTDNKGNIIFVGLYSSEQLNIENYTLNNKTVKGEGGGDILIVKYSPDGKVIWAKSIGGSKGDGGYATCAIDKEENISVTGQFYSDKFLLDSLELTKSKNRGADVFLAKFSSNGKLLWAKSSHGPDTFDSETQSCSVDTQGNIIISGWFVGPYIAFDNDTLKKNAEKTNKIFVAKYSSTGKLIWANSYGGSVATTRVDGEGNIILGGMFTDSILKIGNTTLYNKGKVYLNNYLLNNILLVKLNPDGKEVWANSANGNSSVGIRNFCVDKKGNIIVTGAFTGDTLIIGNNVLTNIDRETEDIFIAAYSPEGKVLWAKSAGGVGRNVGRSCVADNKGNIYLTGSFDVNKLAIGPLILTNSGDSDVFIVKLSPK